MGLVTIPIIVIAVYLYTAFAVREIGNKRKVQESWLAFIPVLHLLVLLWTADLDWWWLLVAIVVSWIPFIGGLALLAGFIYMWRIIAKKLKFPKWHGILMILPIVNLVLLGVMAWKK